jgi:hypothetical protein
MRLETATMDGKVCDHNCEALSGSCGEEEKKIIPTMTTSTPQAVQSGVRFQEGL